MEIVCWRTEVAFVQGGIGKGIVTTYHPWSADFEQALPSSAWLCCCRRSGQLYDAHRKQPEELLWQPLSAVHFTDLGQLSQGGTERVPDQEL